MSIHRSRTWFPTPENNRLLLFVYETDHMEDRSILFTVKKIILVHFSNFCREFYIYDRAGVPLCHILQPLRRHHHSLFK
jgi:hypothetical protein